MKKNLCALALLLMAICLQAQPLPTEGKVIYIPKELRNLDWNDPESQWSYHRMALTDNFAIFWEKGFGKDLASPPPLEGHEMRVDLENLERKLERFYHFFRDTLQFTRPGSKCDSLRMMVMINYSLEGTAYGGDYDGQIGALWIAPNRVQDQKLNCIAHELGHCFQAQITCDGEGEAWGGCGFFEMTSQWMLWQVNPLWPLDEQYHWDAFCKNTHKAFLHLDNIYRSPYVLQHWSEGHGLPFIAELFRQGKRGEDPAMTYKRLTGLSQEAFADEMFRASRRMVCLDFRHAFAETRPLRGMMTTPMDTLEGAWLRPALGHCPENYGFNVIPLPLLSPGQTVEVSFRGEAGAKGNLAGWRYGVVAETQEGKVIYGEIYKVSEGRLHYAAPADQPLSQLWLVVMGAPTEHQLNQEGGTYEQWPYRILIHP